MTSGKSETNTIGFLSMALDVTTRWRPWQSVQRVQFSREAIIFAVFEANCPGVLPEFPFNRVLKSGFVSRVEFSTKYSAGGVVAAGVVLPAMSVLKVPTVGLGKCLTPSAARACKISEIMLCDNFVTKYSFGGTRPFLCHGDGSFVKTILTPRKAKISQGMAILAKSVGRP